MTDWTNSKLELRNLLSDGDTDRFRHRKNLIGIVNGINKSFKTFEFRLVTDLSTAVDPLGIYVNGVHVAVTSADKEFGDSILTAAPVEGDTVEGSYYYQWFKDSELDSFLLDATRWLGLGEDPLKIPAGLRPAALHYSAQSAYHKLAARFAEQLSDAYRFQDVPNKENGEFINQFKGLSKDFKEKATELRDNYYQGYGAAKKPYSVSIGGNVQSVIPKR